jgi:lipid A 3-O-deacylase
MRKDMTMKTALHFAIVASVIATVGPPVAAQELIVGAGYTQFFDDLSIDSAKVSLEYRHSPFYERGRIDIALAAATVVHTSGDFFLGGGLSARYALHQRWFIEASVMPGAYWKMNRRTVLAVHSKYAVNLRLGTLWKAAIGYLLGSHTSPMPAPQKATRASILCQQGGISLFDLTPQWVIDRRVQRNRKRKLT